MVMEAVGSTFVLKKDYCLKRVDEIIEDYEYQLKRKLAPSRRRSYEGALEFFKSIKHHLTNTP